MWEEQEECRRKKVSTGPPGLREVKIAYNNHSTSRKATNHFCHHDFSHIDYAFIQYKTSSDE